MLKLGTIAIDGTHIRANASKNKNLTYERAEQLDALLEQDIEALMQEAKQADRQDNQRPRKFLDIKSPFELRSKLAA